MIELDTRAKAYYDKYVLVTKLIEQLREDNLTDSVPWQSSIFLRALSWTHYTMSYIDKEGVEIRATLDIRIDSDNKAMWYFWVNEKYAGGIDKPRKIPASLDNGKEAQAWVIEQVYKSLYRAQERALKKLEPS